MCKRVAGVVSHLFLDFLQRSRCLFFRLSFMVSQSGTIIESSVSKWIWEHRSVIRTAQGGGAINLFLPVSFTGISKNVVLIRFF